MKKIISLVKVSLNHDMNIFKINTKKQSVLTKYLLPLIIMAYIMGIIGLYAYQMMQKLHPMHLEYTALSIFVFIISILTLIEGIYKSSSLLFNCKDDQLLFSLPIKRRTVLFIRIFKFYVFEFLYNSLFLLPAIGVYAYLVNPSWTFYLVSIFALILLPIFPIAISCIVGFIITFFSSKFKGKNIVQTVFTTIILLGIFYLSYNLKNMINSVVKSAESINNILNNIYYPVNTYISLVNDFNIKTLLIYIVVHILVFVITIFILGKVYFKINSNYKKVTTIHKKNTHYKIKCHSKMSAFIKKELNRFISTPVFITNAGFGLVLYIIACIFICIKFDTIEGLFTKILPDINIVSMIPLLLFGLICFGSLMTSITSSMISLESKSFNILKSLPIKPFKIVLYKVLASLIIVIPFILVGDIIVFIRFKFDLINILLILIASFILPFVTELIGILINLKYPKMDATNDTEIVKQSMSSSISVFIGMGLIGITFFVLFRLINIGLANNLIMLIFVGTYGLIGLCLWILLIKTCDKSFNNIIT